MSAFSERVGLPTEHAEAQLATGRVAWCVMSGKMCSGKDTVAPLLSLPGGFQVISYGNILRENLAPALEKLKAARSTGEGLSWQLHLLEGELALDRERAEEALGLLLPDLQREPALTPWSRTTSMRQLLQKLGSDWLPDEDYLPREAAKRAVPLFEEGVSVIAAGSRFLPDVELPTLAGALTLRLDVTPETQLRRLEARDGLEPTQEVLAQLSHPGETELDSYPFTIRVANDDEAPGKLEEVVARLQGKVDEVLAERQKAAQERAGV